MNKLLWGSLSLALLFAVGVRADDKKTEKKEDKKEDKKPDAARGQRGQRGQRGEGGTFQFGRGGAALLSEKEMEELKLSDKQKDQISKIVKDYDAKRKEAAEGIQKTIKDLREGGNPDMEKIRELLQKMGEATRSGREKAEKEITAVLDDGQKKKFDDLKKARPQRGVFPGAGGFGRPAFTPGQILPPGAKDRLELTDDQKKKVDELEKKVKDELNKILTDDQKKKLEQGGGRPGGGRPGTNRPGGRPGSGRPGSDL